VTETSLAIMSIWEARPPLSPPAPRIISRMAKLPELALAALAGLIAGVLAY
jgi:hypothetical protein